MSDGCFAPGVVTFAQFAESTLQSGSLVRPVSRLVKRHLVRRCVDQAQAEGRLAHFGPIASTAGLLDLVCDFTSELKRLEIWPEDLRHACMSRGITPKDRELLAIYEAYQRCLLDHQLYDAEGRFWSARDRLQRAEPGMSKGENVQCPTGPSPDRAIIDHCTFASFGHSPQLVVADGFTDFTQTQHEILEILGARAAELWISLPLEPEPCRRDLFGKPLSTLAELRRRHAAVRIDEQPRPERPAWPAMDHLERMLFVNPRKARPASDTAGLEILAAGRQLGEIELLGARIKRLLLEGDTAAGSRPVPPADIAVVFRRPQEVGDLVGEVFRKLGIPFALQSGRPLGRAPLLATLVALLRLDADDWPMPDLLAILGSNYLSAGLTAGVERTIRGLQIPRGRKQLIGRLAKGPLPPPRRVRDKETGKPGDKEIRGEGEGGLPGPPGGPTDNWQLTTDNCLRAARAVVGHLADALDGLPERATLPEWGRAWQRLAERLGLLRAAAGSLPAGHEHAVADEDAWRQLQAAVAEIHRVSRWLGQEKGTVPFSACPERQADENRDSPQVQCSPHTPCAEIRHTACADYNSISELPRLDRRQAMAELVDILNSEPIAGGGEEWGRVRVLSAAGARGLRIPYLFMAGLSEKSFPAPVPENRVYSEPERQRLVEEGLPLTTRNDRQADEMLLFYEVLACATRRLYLSYPAANESGEPLLPSPFLNEVEQACGAGRIARSEKLDLSPLPDDDRSPSWEAFRLRAVSRALEGDVAMLAGLAEHAPAAADNLLAGLEIVARRQDRRRFGPAEGMLGCDTWPALVAMFPPERTFSATELERYASCPYRFFLERLLKIEPVEDLALEIDSLERGRLVHEFLAALHRRVNAGPGGPRSPASLPDDEYDRLADETLQALSSDRGEDSLRDALAEVDRRWLRRVIADYRRQHQRYDAAWADCDVPLRPELFEIAFGRPLREGDEHGSTAEPLTLDWAGRSLRLAGRIDRIDTGRVLGRTVFNVIDYKTGGSVRFSVEGVARGTTIQLPLYALAAAELILSERNAVPWQAGYWYVGSDGFKPRQALKMYHAVAGALEPLEEWEQIRSLLARTVAGLLQAMRGGEFPAWSAEAECTGRCPFHTVCRINHVRSLEKTWPGPIP
jgi:RecB family exonuclease